MHKTGAVLTVSNAIALKFISTITRFSGQWYVVENDKEDWVGSYYSISRLWIHQGCCLERNNVHKEAMILLVSHPGLLLSVISSCCSLTHISWTSVMSSNGLSPPYVVMMTKFVLSWTKLTKLIPNRYVISFLLETDSMFGGTSCKYLLPPWETWKVKFVMMHWSYTCDGWVGCLSQLHLVFTWLRGTQTWGCIIWLSK